MYNSLHSLLSSTAALNVRHPIALGIGNKVNARESKVIPLFFVFILMMTFGINMSAQWVSLEGMQQQRVQFGAVATQESIYVWGGGIDGTCGGIQDNLTNSMEIFDKVSGLWSQGPDFPEFNRGMAYALCDNGFIYSIGGIEDANFYFDPMSNTWHPIASPPILNWEGAAATGCQDMLHVFGGATDPTAHFIYNTLTDTWSAGLPIPQGMNQHVAITVGQKIFLIGGSPAAGSSAHDIVQIYDVNTMTWSTGANMPFPRTQHGATLTPDGKILIAGGKLDWFNLCPPVFSDVLIYDPITNTWDQSPDPFPVPTGELQIVTCGETIFAIGGFVDNAGPVVVNDLRAFCFGEPACTNQNISLNEVCLTEVIPNMVLSPATFCEDLYEITIFDKYGVPRPDNFVNADDIGETFEYEINHINNPFACSGIITVEDKLEPEIACRDTVLNCLEMLNYPGPTATDNCGNVSVRLVKEEITPLKCDDDFVKVILMGYVAEDDSGNESDTCWQEINVRRLVSGDISFPMAQNIITLRCDSNWAKDANGYPSPTVTGSPMAFGDSLYNYQDLLCNITVEYFDTYYPGCTSRITRIWEINEWHCSTIELLGMYTQEIHIVDEKGPSILLPNTMTVYTERRSCSATFNLPQALVQDACHNGKNTVHMKLPDNLGTIKNNGGSVTLPVGDHYVKYIAWDSCYQMSEDSIQVIVEDRSAPVAVCEEHIVVSLTPDGTATIPAENFDDGSYDPCGIQDIQVRRMTDSCNVAGNTDWGDEVAFCCADVGPGKRVMVAMQVEDVGGKKGQCMVSVEVQDKLPPRLIPLPDMTISCEYAIDTTRLFEFGKIATHPQDRDTILASNMQATFSTKAYDGLASDNCDVSVQESFDISIDNCGKGWLRRYFKVQDPQQFMIFDTQYIRIIDRDPFDSTDIVWPNDLDTINVCNMQQTDPKNLPSQYRPRITGDTECSLVGIDHEDTELPITRGETACLKILRKWTIIDWCSQSSGTYKRWRYEQILKFGNDQAPEILSSCNDTTVCSIDPTCSSGYIELIAEGQDECTPVNELFWTFEIDYNDDGTIDSTGLSNDASGDFPIGVHRIYWFLEDRCGNSDQCDYTFEIQNCTGPLVYCRNGLIVSIDSVDTDNDGIIDDTLAYVRAEYLDLGSSHPCNYGLTFSFAQDSLVDTMFFRCPEVGDSLVQMWVTAPNNGISGSCLVTISVVDSFNICGMSPSPLVSVTGSLKTNRGVNVQNASVFMEGSQLPPYETDKTGTYAFPAMRTGGTYQILPEKKDGLLEGVSTKDLIAIQQHLLGITPLNNPYSMIAADINNSGSISAKDLTELRKTILGIQPGFTNNNSWRFVLGSYQFPDLSNPWLEQFPEYENIGVLSQDEIIDFTGVKIGDVDESFSFTGSSTESRTTTDETVALVLHEAELSEKYGWVIPVYLSSEIEINGLQFDLMLKNKHQMIRGVIPAELWNTGSGQFNEEVVPTGQVKASWMKDDKFSGNELFFYVQFSSLGRDLPKTYATLNENDIRPEAYDKELNDYPVIVRTKIAPVKPMELNVAPNPWSDIVNVKISNAIRGKGVLMIFDQNGKQIWQRQERIVHDGLDTYIRRHPQWKSGTYYLVFDQGDVRETITIILSE